MSDASGGLGIAPTRRVDSPVRVLVVGSGGREHALAWKLAQSPRLDELHAAPGQPGHRRARRVPPGARRGRRRASSTCATTLDVDLVVVGPEAPLVAGRRRQAAARAAIAVFGPSAAAARIEGSKSFAKEVMRGGRRPDRGRALDDRARPPCVVKADGLAAGQGRLRLPHRGGARRRPARGRRARRRARDRGAARGRGGLALRALPTAREARRRSRRRRTSSGSATATRARTPAGWARTRPCPGSATPRSRSSSTRSTGRCSPSSPRAARRSRAALRRADADRRRAAGARVQLPLRRPRDAVDPAAPRGRPARGARRAPRRAICSDAELAVADRGRGDGRARGAATIPSAATAARRSTGSRTPRRPARSSSTPAPRCTTDGSSRTAAGSST